jgi:hypothetical protein
VLLNIFNKYLLADEFMEAAYEGFSPEIKGWIKKTLPFAVTIIVRTYLRNVSAQLPELKTR